MEKITIIEPPGSGPNPRAHWSEELQREFDQNYNNGVVGYKLVSETDLARSFTLINSCMLFFSVKPGWDISRDG